MSKHSYQRIERERRFVLDRLPNLTNAAGTHRITDRYIDETRLRLRHQVDDRGSVVFKLTQKIQSPGTGAQQGFLTTIYLNEQEFALLSALPAKQLRKTRYSLPPFGIDVFEDTLAGLVLAEAEFESDCEAESLELPSFILHEVTEDLRFTGGSLAQALRREAGDWLRDYGIELGPLETAG